MNVSYAAHRTPLYSHLRYLSTPRRGRPGADDTLSTRLAAWWLDAAEYCAARPCLGSPPAQASAGSGPMRGRCGHLGRGQLGCGGDPRPRAHRTDHVRIVPLRPPGPNWARMGGLAGLVPAYLLEPLAHDYAVGRGDRRRRRAARAPSCVLSPRHRSRGAGAAPWNAGGQRSEAMSPSRRSRTPHPSADLSIP